MLLKLRGTQGRQFRYVTLSHYLSPFKKKIFFHLGVGSRIDTLIVYSAAQQALATEVLRMPAERVVKLPFFVDKDFWRPVAIDRNATKNRPMIFAPGLECRDFATLIRAVSDLGCGSTYYRYYCLWTWPICSLLCFAPKRVSWEL
jgi:hypothetical protein